MSYWFLYTVKRGYQRATPAVKAVPMVALLLSLAPAFSVAADAPLTLSAAQSRAMERSRQLSANDLAARASRDMAVAAGQRPDPVLSAGIDNLPVTGSDRFSTTRDFMTMRSVGVMQEITRKDKLRFRSERYEREAEKFLAERAATAAQIQQESAKAWFRLFYAQEMAKVVADQLAQADLEIKAAEGAYRAGQGSQADVYMARSARAAIENRVSEVKRQVDNARVLLARWLGATVNAPLASKPPTDVLRMDAAALESHLVHHPQIVALGKQEDVAKAEANLANANRKSDWTVQFNYNKRGSEYSDMVSFGVSIPLQWDRKNRQDRELSARLAMVEQARAERDEALRVHLAELRTMINEWENARERHARYQKQLIPLANDRIAAAVSAYRGGSGKLADVLAARREAIDVRLEALALHDEIDRLWAEISFLYPDESLGPDVLMRTTADSMPIAKDNHNEK